MATTFTERYHPTLSSYYRHITTLGDYLALLATSTSNTPIDLPSPPEHDALQSLLKSHLVAWNDGRFDDQLGSTSRMTAMQGDIFDGTWCDVTMRQQSVRPLHALQRRLKSSFASTPRPSTKPSCASSIVTPGELVNAATLTS